MQVGLNFQTMLEELDLQEMNEIKGGISKEEYCNTVSMLIEHNWDSWSDGERKSAASAYATHC